MTDDLPTEPLRTEHRQLLPHLRALDTAADEIDQWDRDELVHVLGEIVGFLREHLVPHATAEEQVLYPRSKRRWELPVPPTPCGPTTARS